MTNRDKLSKMSIFDLLIDMTQCVLLLVSDMSLEDKCNRCRKYRYGDCDRCIQEWLNKEVTNDGTRT